MSLRQPKIKIISVVGARPNFVKIATFVKKIKQANRIQHVLVHTGQHYDQAMSDSFFRDLDITKPDINLGVKEKSHAAQTAEIMKRFEKVCVSEKPDIVVVVGDVNSTVACALTAVKLGIKVAHIEAGLRSFDRSMPEEINRIITDSISDYLFVTEESGVLNLLREGRSKKQIYFVGNTMIDTLIAQNGTLEAKDVLQRFKVNEKEYVVVTLHRPSNVDRKAALKSIMKAIHKGARGRKVLFPVHPRTQKKLNKWNIATNGIYVMKPLGYHDFMTLIKNAAAVITDSGGIQEETSFLGVPCVTVRENTERPITVTIGTNIIAGTTGQRIVKAIQKSVCGHTKIRRIPKWDGQASNRIIKILTKLIKDRI